MHAGFMRYHTAVHVPIALAVNQLSRTRMFSSSQLYVKHATLCDTLACYTQC
jgi:hypothetical protein